MSENADLSARLHADAEAAKAKAEALKKEADDLLREAADEDAAANALAKGVATPAPGPTTVPVTPSPIGTDVPPPGPGQAPGTPPAPADARHGTLVGVDGDAFTEAVGGRYTYGVTDRLIEFHLSKGAYKVLPESMGVKDPAFGVVKQLYRLGDDVVSAPPAAPAPMPAGSVTREAIEALTGLHYGLRIVDTSGMAQSFPDGSPGNQSMNEPDTGYQSDIGIVTQESAMFAINPNAQSIGCITANALTSRWHPVHISHPDAPGVPIDWEKHPNFSVDSSSRGDSNYIPDPEGNPAIVVDRAHMPHFLYMRALYCGMTGDAAGLAWTLLQMKWWVSRALVTVPDNARGYALGICSPLASGFQPRGAGWTLVALFQATHVMALFAKDDSDLPRYLRAVQNNIDFYLGVFVPGEPDYPLSGFAPYYDLPTGVLRNERGIMSGPNGAYGTGPDGKTAFVGGFQSAFQTQAVLFGFGLKLPLAPGYTEKFERWARWAARYSIDHAGPANTPGAWDWRRFGEYAEAVGTIREDGGIDFWTIGEAYKRNYEGFPEVPLSVVAFLNHDSNTILEGIPGGYVDNGLPGIGIAARLGFDGAAEGITRLKTAAQWPAGGSAQFGIIDTGFFDDAVLGTAPAPAPAPVPVSVPPTTPGPAPAPHAPIPLPSPSAGVPDWVLQKVGHGPVPFKNSLRDALPDGWKDMADNSYTEDWPGADFDEETDDYFVWNGGHQVVNIGAIVVSNLRTLTNRITNQNSRRKLENAMPTDGGADADGDLKAYHCYQGLLVRPPIPSDPRRLLVRYEVYNVGFNPIAYYDVSKAVGGGDVYYKGDRNRFFWHVGGLPCAATWKAGKGVFLGDGTTSGYDRPELPKFGFIPWDTTQDPDFSWPCPIFQWGFQSLTVDEDRQLLIAIGDRSLTLIGLDPAKPDSYKKMVSVPFVWLGKDPGGMQANRAGFKWLRGCGIVGIHKDPSNEANGLGVQIVLGANPLVDAATARIVMTGIPTLPQGHFGAAPSIHKWGISFFQTGPDSLPHHIRWPLENASTPS